MRKVCKNVSSRPTDLLCRFCWNDSACLPYACGSLHLPATTTQLFSQSLSSHAICSCLEILATTNFWHSKLQQVSTYAFCSWDDIFTQKWNCSSPKNLCQCNESPSTLSTNTSIEWNLYLYSSVVIMSPEVSFKTKGKQPSNGTFVLPSLLYSIGSVCILSECMRTKFLETL